MNRTFHSAGETETERLGAAVAKLLAAGAVLALEGEIGSGKTVFTRGVGRARGVSEPITSPTFAIAQEYRCPDGLRLLHLDLYRIRDADAALAFGIDEYLSAAAAITVIEWPDRIRPLLAAATVFTIRFEHVAPDRRRIVLPETLARGLEGIL